MVFSGTVQPGYLQIVERMDLEAEIGPRTRLSLQEYEDLHENRRSPDRPLLEPSKEFVLMHIKTSPDSRGERRYGFCE